MIACHRKVKAGLRRFTQDLHTRTGLSPFSKLILNSLLKTSQFNKLRSHLVYCDTTSNGWMDVNVSTPKGSRDNNCTQVLCNGMNRE